MKSIFCFLVTLSVLFGGLNGLANESGEPDAVSNEGGCSAATIVCGICPSSGTQMCTAVACNGSVTQFQQICAEPSHPPVPVPPSSTQFDCGVYCTASQCPYAGHNKTFFASMYSYESTRDAYDKARSSCLAAGRTNGCYMSYGPEAGCR